MVSNTFFVALLLLVGASISQPTITSTTFGGLATPHLPSGFLGSILASGLSQGMTYYFVPTSSNNCSVGNVTVPAQIASAHALIVIDSPLSAGTYSLCLTWNETVPFETAVFQQYGTINVTDLAQMQLSLMQTISIGEALGPMCVDQLTGYIYVLEPNVPAIAKYTQQNVALGSNPAPSCANYIALRRNALYLTSFHWLVCDTDVYVLTDNNETVALHFNASELGVTSFVNLDFVAQYAGLLVSDGYIVFVEWDGVSTSLNLTAVVPYYNVDNGSGDWAWTGPAFGLLPYGTLQIVLAVVGSSNSEMLFTQNGESILTFDDERLAGNTLVDAQFWLVAASLMVASDLEGNINLYSLGEAWGKVAEINTGEALVPHAMQTYGSSTIWVATTTNNLLQYCLGAQFTVVASTCPSLDGAASLSFSNYPNFPVRIEVFGSTINETTFLSNDLLFGFGEGSSINVTVYDAIGCPSNYILPVTTTNLQYNVASTNVTVLNGYGSINVSVSGGIPPYSIAWNPSTISGFTSENATVGTYTAVITDQSGCYTELTVLISDDVVTTGAVTTMAVTTSAITTQALTTQALTTQALTTVSITTQALSTAAVSTRSVTTVAASTQAVSTGLQTTQAVSTGALSTAALSTEALTTAAISTEAVSTEAVSTGASASTGSVSTQGESTESVTTSAISTAAISTSAVNTNASTTNGESTTGESTTGSNVAEIAASSSMLLSPGLTATVIIVPIVGVAIIILIVVEILRRRNQKSAADDDTESGHQMTSMSSREEPPKASPAAPTAGATTKKPADDGSSSDSGSRSRSNSGSGSLSRSGSASDQD